MAKASSNSPTNITPNIVLRLLRRAKKPLTLREIQAQTAPESSSHHLRKVVDDLLFEGNIFVASPKNRAPRYWGKDEEDQARKQVLKLLANKPLPKNELLVALSSHFQTGSSAAWRLRLIDKLVADHGLFIVPSCSGNRAARVSVTPPNINEYLQKPATLLKEVCDRLASTGVSKMQVLDAIRNLILEGTSQPDRDMNGHTVTSVDHRQIKELAAMLLKKACEMKPLAEKGAMVSLRELRGRMLDIIPTKEYFDEVVMFLASRGQIDLHRHDNPNALKEAERDKLVKDNDGNFYIGLVVRSS